MFRVRFVLKLSFCFLKLCSYSLDFKRTNLIFLPSFFSNCVQIYPTFSKEPSWLLFFFSLFLIGKRVRLTLNVSNSVFFSSWIFIFSNCIQTNPTFQKNKPHLSLIRNRIQLILNVSSLVVFKFNFCIIKFCSDWPDFSKVQT